MSRRKIALMGATGSIGKSALSVIQEHPEALELVAIAAGSRARKLAEIAKEYNVAQAVVYDEEACADARQEGLFPSATYLDCGEEGLVALAGSADYDILVMAITGTVGLNPTLAAIRAGKTIALASKEILVLAGQFIMAEANRCGATILPLDSEHNAVFQCLQGDRDADPRPLSDKVEEIILTASGGAFRDASLEEMEQATVEDALRHPNWSMGQKITIDSATLANKGLEMIEASWLFGLPVSRIKVVVHRQSIVHSLIRFRDGSLLAQLSPPSMTYAMRHTLLFPQRPNLPEGNSALDFTRPLQLDFHAPDLRRFPCLGLARQAAQAGGLAPAAYNTANDCAVKAFLDRRLPLLGIPRVIEQTLHLADFSGSCANIDSILSAETGFQALANEVIASLA